jgi:multidrug efflux pump subunit AcrA (membrane-fusion protein)
MAATTHKTNKNQNLWQNVTKHIRSFSIFVKTFIKKNPMRAFLLVLGVLFLLMIGSKLLQPNVVKKETQNPVKAVHVYTIGNGPQATFQAKIEKAGVIKIVAQTAGVVQFINVKEGDKIWTGQQIVALSTNYQGGNAASLQRQIAQTQYQNLQDTFDEQNQLIDRNYDVATASAQNAQQVRDMTRDSANDTNNLINDNQQKLDAMKQQLATTPQSDPQYVSLQTGIAQLQSGIDQLRSAQRTASYQGANDKPPALLSTLQEDITKKQLDLQRKGLGVTKEVSRLSTLLSSVSEALMYPSSPFDGTVERIYVHEGQIVNPGTVIASITSDTVSTTAILQVPATIAQIMRQDQFSELQLADKKVSLKPYHIATEATDGELYSIVYAIPDAQQKLVTDGEYITINVPISTGDETNRKQLIPLDAVYQTQESSSVLLLTKNKAETKNITLGSVYGDYVEVTNGLTFGDHLILDRNIIAGDNVRVWNN